MAMPSLTRLDDDAGGLFTIDANTGEVTVAGNLDYETATEPHHHSAGDFHRWIQLYHRYDGQR